MFILNIQQENKNIIPSRKVGACMAENDKKPNMKRKYPTIYERTVPIAISILVVMVVAMLLITIAIAVGIYMGVF